MTISGWLPWMSRQVTNDCIALSDRAQLLAGPDCFPNCFFRFLPRWGKIGNGHGVRPQSGSLRTDPWNLI